MIRVGVVGAAGYVGGEICRLLLLHPEVEFVFAQSSSSAGEPLYSIHEDLLGDSEMLFSQEVDPTVDVMFLCSGHGKSLSFLESCELAKECVVIDLGNDFRLQKDAQSAGREFAYGLSDFFGSEVERCGNVANPGCFATAIQQAILPLASVGALTDDIHITAITGSTGAGQKPSATTHFSWRANNLSTYKTFSHQHLGEIGESIIRLQPSFNSSINFVPYRGDFPRGIIATIHTKCQLSLDETKNIFDSRYADSPFTFVSAKPINLKQVVNTNKSLLYIEKHGDYLLITSIIDNLLRGAAGQAIENMNRIFGLPLSTGLKLKASAF
ncbi:MAG: N-acetyl-gamma-glutamyl-phosphate reductase [Rikenellaceae bacterium]